MALTKPTCSKCGKIQTGKSVTMTATWIHIANTAAVEHHLNDQDEVKHRAIEGERITELVYPDEDWNTIDIVNNAYATYRMHQAVGNDHTSKLVTPPWIRSNNTAVEGLLMEKFAMSRNEVDKHYGNEHDALKRTSISPVYTSSAFLTSLMLPMAIAALWGVYKLSTPLLRTNGGRDYQSNLMGNPSSNGTGSYAPACYVGLTSDATPPSVTDTVLPGEFSSGTLARAQAVYAHTTGAASYTLSKLFVSDQNTTIGKIGLFNVSTGGVPFIETVLAQVATMNSGDQIQVVEVVTL